MGELERRLDGRRGRLTSAVGCGLLGMVVFAPATGSGRLADDYVLLRTVRSVTGLIWPFTHNDLGQAAGSSHFYRPLWVLLNAAVYQLSHSPVVAHLFNILLFGVICAEVVILLGELGGGVVALIGGVFFAVFPSHGESIAWISGNTDAIAVAFGLAALLAGLRPRPSAGRDLAVAMLTILAMLAKEEAAVLPAVLAVLLAARAPDRSALRDGGLWRPVLAMLAAVAVELILRSLVISGIGGYGGQPFTVKRAAGSLVSFTVAALSAPQLLVLAHPALLVVPVAAVGLVVFGIVRLWRTGDAARARLALAGLAWFLLALVPVLNQPLNLNTRNGDRLLLLPSVGLALTVGVLGATIRRRALLAGLGAVAVACAACTVLDARDWRTAGTESARLLADIDRLAPPAAHVVVLSVPSDYGAAHLYPDALDAAMQESGRPDLTLTLCMPVHALELRPHQVSFQPIVDGYWLGRATARDPFDVPVLGSSTASQSGGCAFGKAPHQPPTTLGTALTAIVKPLAAPSGGTVYLYFDGLDLRLAPRPSVR